MTRLILLAVLLLTPAALGQYGQAPPQQPAQQPPQEMRFGGNGLLLVIDQFDPNTMTMGGTLTVDGGPPMQLSGRVAEDPQAPPFYQAVTGQVQTPQGPKPIRIVDESETVARVTFDGQDRRVRMDGRADEPVGPPQGGEGEMPQFPVVYEGGGLTLTIEGIDAQTGEIRGTFDAGDGPMPTTASNVVAPNGTEYAAGSVQTSQGPRPITAMDETETTIIVGWDGRSHRLTLRQDEPAAPPPPPPPPPPPGGGDAPPPPPPPPAAEEQPQASAGPREPVVLRQHTFADDADVPSHTMLVPKGWSVEGGAFWADPRAFYKVLPSFNGKVTAPDGQQVAVLPNVTLRWEAGDLPGMRPPQKGGSIEGHPAVPLPTTETEWERLVIEDVLKPAFPNATDVRVVSRQDLAPVTAALREQNRPMWEQMAQSATMMNGNGMQNGFSADAAATLYEVAYAEDGRQYEAGLLLVHTATTNSTRMQDMMTGAWQGFDSTFWTLAGVAVRVPAGRDPETELPTLMAVANSLRETPQFSKMKADLLRKLYPPQQGGGGGGGYDPVAAQAKLGQTYAEIGEITAATGRSIAGDDNGAGSMDRFTNVISGTDAYHVPGQGDTSVQLPYTHDHVYTNGQGEYVLSHDAMSTPSQMGYDGDWTRMEAVHP